MFEQLWFNPHLFFPLSFYAYSFSELKKNLDKQQMHEIALLLLLFLAAVLLVSIIIYLYRSHRRKAFVPASWVTSPQQIRAMLETAMQERNTFELQFPERNNYKRPTIRCSPESVTPGHMVVEASYINTVAQHWTGRLVNCYFRITVNGQGAYYTFSTRIERVESKADDHCYLYLQLPGKIENRQKRSFLRITPPDEYVLGAAMWRRTQFLSGSSQNDLLSWPEPSMTLTPGSPSDFIIRDISSGGLRLVIPYNKVSRAFKTEFAISDQLIVQLDLLDPEVQKRMRFWMLCRVQNTTTEFETRNLELGLQFMAWATPGSNASTHLQWLRLTSSNEVDPLGNWIIRRHLEMFRENPEE